MKKNKVRRVVVRNGEARNTFHQRNWPKDKDGYFNHLFKLGQTFDQQ